MHESHRTQSLFFIHLSKHASFSRFTDFQPAVLSNPLRLERNTGQKITSTHDPIYATLHTMQIDNLWSPGVFFLTQSQMNRIMLRQRRLQQAPTATLCWPKGCRSLSIFCMSELSRFSVLHMNLQRASSRTFA